MGVVDTVILFAYLALLVGIGIYAQRRKPDVDDYFVAGRRMGPATIACMWVAAWIGGASIVGTSARVYAQGITGIWYVLGIAIGCCLFGLTVAKRVKQLGDGDRHLTYPDFIERHYDNRTRAVATITTVLAYTAYSAGQFAAAAAILQVLIGWSYGSSLLLAGAIVTLYTAAGGYLAVTFTDRVQVTLVLVGIVAVGVPVAISQAGSWADMHAVLPAAHYDFGAQGWDRVAALVVSMVLSFFVAMDSFSRSFAARDAAAAQRGALLAPVLMLPIAVAVAWLGLAAAVLYPDPASSASILATFVLDRFPVGLKGLMVIGILSAVMSVASISVLTASANYARDIHQRYLRPDITPAAMLRIGTLASLGAGGLGLLLAWKMRDIIDILQFGFTLNSAGLFLPTIAALWTDRVPASAAFWSTQRLARDGHRLAHRGRCRRGRRLRHRSAVAGPRRFRARCCSRSRSRARDEHRLRRDAGGRGTRSVDRAAPPARRRAHRDLHLPRRPRRLARRLPRCRRDPDRLRAVRPCGPGALKRCRIISVAATGWDCVDVAAAAAHGIRVAAVGEYCTDEVADHTLALLLALDRRLLAYHRQVQVDHDWRWDRVDGRPPPRRPDARPRRLRAHRPGRLSPRARLRPRCPRRRSARACGRRAPPRRGARDIRRSPRARGHHQPALQSRRERIAACMNRATFANDGEAAAAHQRRARRPDRRGRPRGSARCRPRRRRRPRRARRGFAGPLASSARRPRRRAADAACRVLFGGGPGRPAAHLGGEYPGLPRWAPGRRVPPRAGGSA